MKCHHCSIEQVLRSSILYTGNEWIWVKHLSFCEFALNSIVVASTSKAPIELLYGENVIVPLDYLTGTTQLLHLQAAWKMAEEVSWLVDLTKTESKTA